MNTLSTRSRIPVTLAVAGLLLVGTPSMTGCSIVNNLVGSATGGNLPDGLGGGQSVPSDFPSEVPLVDGEVVFGVSLPGDNGEKAWNVTINVSGADAFESITTQLTDAGFEYQGLTEGESGSSGKFTKDPLTVLVVVAAGNGSQWTANYTVTNAETSQ